MIAIAQTNNNKDFEELAYKTITRNNIFMIPEHFLERYMGFLMVLEGGKKQFVTVDRILKQLGKTRADI